jgi:hypothetical protein
MNSHRQTTFKWRVVMASAVVALLGSACESGPLSEPAVEVQRSTSDRASTIESHRVKPATITQRERLLRATLRPNSHFHLTPGGEVGHVTPGRPSATERTLYIIDGVDRGFDFNIDDLAPSDVVDIKALSGEAGVKRFGDRAKGGVTLITTKKAGR